MGSIIKLKTIGAFSKIIRLLRVAKYRLLSTASNVTTNATLIQPAYFTGNGRIRLGQCVIGNNPSPFLFSGYSYFDARDENSLILIEDRVHVNNNAVIVVEKTSIKIMSDTLIGTDFFVCDSDFHEIAKDKRNSGQNICKPVVIGKNVFIGASVKVLKGSQIGDNCVVGAGSIVSGVFPSNKIIAGIPAKVIGEIE